MSQVLTLVLPGTGAQNWLVPLRVHHANAFAWGGGAGSFGASAVQAGRGGAGAALASSQLEFTPGSLVPYFIGAGGVAGASNAAGGDGGDSWMVTSGTLLAKGATAATTIAGTSTGGQASASIGTVKFSGGNSTSTGGGGSAGSGGDGGAATTATGGTAGIAGSTFGYPLASFSGAAGRTATTSAVAGVVAGGGASGKNAAPAGVGAAGGNGGIILVAMLEPQVFAVGWAAGGTL